MVHLVDVALLLHDYQYLWLEIQLNILSVHYQLIQHPSKYRNTSNISISDYKRRTGVALNGCAPKLSRTSHDLRQT
jgi:hypothetical protein